MNKFLAFILSCIGVVVLSAVTSLGVHNYLSQNEDSIEKATVNVELSELAEQVTNPKWSTVEEVLQFRQQMQETAAYDSLFLSIPTSVLGNIAQVVIGRSPGATKRDIVEEYERNYDSVYKYIKVTSSQPSGPSHSDTLSVPKQKQVDTIINGKRFQLVREGGGNE